MKASNIQTFGAILTSLQEQVSRLSIQLQKNITLFADVEDVQLPGSVLQALKEPLMHAVRNACDHGIESQGMISVRAYYDGEQAVVEVADNGRGLNSGAILAAALEKGLITAHEAQLMGESEIHALVFIPGFSTAGKVTEISGRGVGMEIVRAGIESIGGTVKLSSVRGEQTSIQFWIPAHTLSFRSAA